MCNPVDYTDLQFLVKFESYQIFWLAVQCSAQWLVREVRAMQGSARDPFCHAVTTLPMQSC